MIAHQLCSMHEMGDPETMNYKSEPTHPCCHPGVTDGAAYPVACGAPAKPGQDHDPADDVEHRRQQGEDHLQLHEGEWQFHLRNDGQLFELPPLYFSPLSYLSLGGDRRRSRRG